MKRLAVLTSLNMPNLMPYDNEVIGLLNATGDIHATPIIWETEAERLKEFDVAIFRTTWGYHEKAEQFSDFLNYLEEIEIPTFNPMHIIKANFHKFYLKELSESGIEIIPTEFIAKGSEQKIDEIISKNSWEKFIIKPAVSAGSYRTHLFSSEQIEDATGVYESMHTTDDLMIQKYLPEVETMGEFSTIFFSNGCRYTINKIPQAGDYRVQFTYGGKYNAIEPNEIINKTSEKIASLFLNDCLYVRVDGLFSEGKFLLMEVEMLEPDLYLNIYPKAIPEFVKSILDKIQTV